MDQASDPPWRELAEAFARQMPLLADVAQRQRAVHLARVLSRRISAAAELVGPGEGGLKRLRTGLKRFRNSLGDQRDREVMGQYLRKMRGASQAAARDWAQGQLAGHGEQSKIAQPKKGWDKLLGPWLARCDALGAAKTGPSMDWGRLERIGQMVQGLRQGPSAASETNPHRVRIELKKWRYAIEAQGWFVASLPADWEKPLKRMQDALGRWHDIVALTHLLEKRMARQSLVYRRTQLHGEVLRMLLSMDRAAAKRWEEFCAAWEESCGELEALNEQVRRAAEQAPAHPSPTIPE